MSQLRVMDPSPLPPPPIALRHAECTTAFLWQHKAVSSQVAAFALAAMLTFDLRGGLMTLMTSSGSITNCHIQAPKEPLEVSPLWRRCSSPWLLSPSWRPVEKAAISCVCGVQGLSTNETWALKQAPPNSLWHVLFFFLALLEAISHMARRRKQTCKQEDKDGSAGADGFVLSAAERAGRRAR